MISFCAGFAFVYFEDERDAEDAIRGLDNVPFGYDKRRLSVEWARVCNYFCMHMRDKAWLLEIDTSLIDLWKINIASLLQIFLILLMWCIIKFPAFVFNFLDSPFYVFSQNPFPLF